MSELQELIDASDAMVADNEHRQVNTREALLGQIKKLSDTLKRLQSENSALREENEWLRALNDEYLENTPTGKKFCKVAWTSIEELVYAMQKLDDIENKKAEMFGLSKLILSKHNTTGDLVRLYISNSNGERVANEARKLTGEVCSKCDGHGHIWMGEDVKPCPECN